MKSKELPSKDGRWFSRKKAKPEREFTNATSVPRSVADTQVILTLD
jgi:hypothetical protein